MKDLRKCEKCGAIVQVIEDCHCENCGIRCCGEVMQKVTANTSDGAAEKHLPVVEVVGNYILVTVNHVMDADHYIEWVALDCEAVSGRKNFKAGEAVKAVFPYVKGSKVLAYCNKHGLWESIVE